MTPPRPKVLSIGVDATLLETRNRVLESAGFDVITSFPALNGDGHIENHDFNLAVLGDSLPRALAVTILQQLKRSRPFIPVVVIYKGGDFCDDFAEADATCGSLDGPEHLIRTISTLIGYSPASGTALEARRCGRLTFGDCALVTNWRMQIALHLLLS